MATIHKGKISSFEADTDRNGDLIKARVLPSTAPTMPTRPLVISWHLRGAMGNLQVGDRLVCENDQRFMAPGIAHVPVDGAVDWRMVALYPYQYVGSIECRLHSYGARKGLVRKLCRL